MSTEHRIVTVTPIPEDFQDVYADAWPEFAAEVFRDMRQEMTVLGILDKRIVKATDNCLVIQVSTCHTALYPDIRDLCFSMAQGIFQTIDLARSGVEPDESSEHLYP